jgi:hypothetical protein
MVSFGDRVVFSSCLGVLLIFFIVHGFVVNNDVLLCGFKQTKGKRYENSDSLDRAAAGISGSVCVNHLWPVVAGGGGMKDEAPVQEPVWIQPDHLQKAQKAPFLCRVEPHKRDDFVPLYPTPPAQPAVPDAIHHTDLSEHPQYIEGWNDCRAEMLKGMK